MKRFLSAVALIALLLGVIPTGTASLRQSENLSQSIVDLRLTRAIPVDEAIAGDVIAWTLQVENLSTNSANQVVVTEILPVGIAVDQLTPSQGKCVLKDGLLLSFECEIGRIEAQQQASLNVVVLIAAELETSELASTAYVVDEAGSVDFNLADNIVSGRLGVESKLSTVDLLVSPLCAAPGSSVLVTGSSLAQFVGAPLVTLDGQLTTASFLSEDALSITIPELATGFAQIQIDDVKVNPAIQIDEGCSIRSIDLDKVRSGFVPGDLLLFFKEGLTAVEIEQFGKEYGFDSVTEYPLLGVHRGHLAQDNNLENEELGANANCPVLKRTTAVELDIVIMIDRSGSMDSIWLREVLGELISQMHCVVNEESRIALVSYSSDYKIDLEFAPWRDQQSKIESWLEQPLQTTGTSDLESALFSTADLFSADENSNPNNIFIVTRGPSIPNFEDEAALVARLGSEDIYLTGIANINQFFIFDTYAPVQDLAMASGRELYYIDHRFHTQLPSVISCTISLGLYGLVPCEEDSFTMIPSKVVDFSRQTEILLHRISEDARIEQVCTNAVVEHSQFADPNLADQTWLTNLGIEYIEEFFPRLGDGVAIALIDTGLDLTLNELGEVELDPNLPQGLNFAIDPDGNLGALDVAGHGSKVASVTSAHENSVNGVGVAPRAMVIPIRVFAMTPDGVRGNSLWVAEAIAAAFLMGADVINMSLGDRSRINVGCKKVSSRDFYERIFNNLSTIAGEEFNRKPPIVVAATGNDGKRVRCPACVESVIAVGSVFLNEDGIWEHSSFSNVGDDIDFVAQGEEVKTTLEGGSFGDTGPGTSFAAPQVAGLAALILAEKPSLTTKQVVDLIKLCFSEDVSEAGWDRETGWGRIRIPAPEHALPECFLSR
jgi:uncharacterized repeat protein (TIGR01451 family)